MQKNGKTSRNLLSLSFYSSWTKYWSAIQQNWEDTGPNPSRTSLTHKHAHIQTFYHTQHKPRITHIWPRGHLFLLYPNTQVSMLIFQTLQMKLWLLLGLFIQTTLENQFLINNLMFKHFHKVFGVNRKLTWLLGSAEYRILGNRPLKSAKTRV